MEKQVIPSENILIKEEVIDSDLLSIDEDNVIKNDVICDGNMLKYISVDRGVIKHEILDMTMTESDDHDILLTDINHMEETQWNESLVKEELIIANGKIIKVEELTGIADFMGEILSHEPNSNNHLRNTCEMTQATGKEGNLLKKVAAKDYNHTCDSTWIKKEVMDDPDDILMKQEPQNDRKILKEDTDEGRHVMDGRIIIKHESFDESTDDDDDALFNDINIEEIPGDENITKEELVMVKGKIIKMEELTGIAGFMGKASSHEPNSNNNLINTSDMTTATSEADLLETTQLCSEKVPGASSLSSFVCAECHRSFLHGVMFQNEDTSLVCEECQKRKLETCQQVRRRGEPTVQTETDSVSPNDMNALLRTPKEGSASSANLTIHQRKYRKRKVQRRSDDKKVLSNEGNKVFVWRTVLKKLVQVPCERAFKCTVCGKQFAYVSGLVRHSLVHSGEKPYKCNKCNKLFPQKTNLNNHLQVHTGKKPFECGVCNKAFALNSALEEHLVVHTGGRTFACTHCGKLFSEKKLLKDHLVTHIGEKRFECDKCNKAFTRKDRLKDHLVRHTGEKPFKCVECNKLYSSKAQLKRHLHVHSKVVSKTGCVKPEETFYQRLLVIMALAQAHIITSALTVPIAVYLGWLSQFVIS